MSARRTMDVAIFGDRVSALPAGWTSETVVSLFGDVRLDASARPGASARLTVVTVFGDTRILVPVGSRVREGGFRLAGDRRVEVEPGDGPEIRVTTYALFGDLVVSDAAG